MKRRHTRLARAQTARHARRIAFLGDVHWTADDFLEPMLPAADALPLNRPASLRLFCHARTRTRHSSRRRSRATTEDDPEHAPAAAA